VTAVQPVAAIEIVVKFGEIGFRRQQQFTSRRQQAGVTNTLGIGKERRRCGVECPQCGIAVIANENGRRTSGRMMTDHRFGFEHNDARVGASRAAALMPAIPPPITRMSELVLILLHTH
jgi:hypothetical protein